MDIEKFASQVALQGHVDAGEHFSLNGAVKEIVSMLDCGRNS